LAGYCLEVQLSFFLLIMPAHMNNDLDNLNCGIRVQVLRALALNRIPGYHFAGNFFGTSFEKVASGGTLVHMDPGPHSVDSGGAISLGGIALLADIAMGTTIRAGKDPSTRLVTTRMHLEFSGVAPTRPILAASSYRGAFDDGGGNQGLSDVSIHQGDELICFGSGAFLAVPVPPGTPELAPFPWRHPDDPEVTPLVQDDLNESERSILRQAEAAMNDHSGDSCFIYRFLGFSPIRTESGAYAEMFNGPHVANRVGHMQGGLQLALAALTAQASLGPDWKLNSISTSFIKSGEGHEIRAESRIIHAGRSTAVVRTQIMNERRQLLEALSTHSQG
jgi:acyl-coenzyme A thioesterase PaaI-like protein